MTRQLCLTGVMLILVSILAPPIAAQEPLSAANIQAVRDADARVKAERTFRFGLSVGWRVFLGETERFVTAAAINPTDSTLHVDKTDATDVVISGLVVAYPFPLGTTAKHRSLGACGGCAIGFAANVTLASFTDESFNTFNSSVEGGIGLTVALAHDFALGVTAERAFRRRLRGFVNSGSRLVADGETVTSLSEDDDRFFVNDNVGAISLKFIYSF